MAVIGKPEGVSERRETRLPVGESPDRLSQLESDEIRMDGRPCLPFENASKVKHRDVCVPCDLCQPWSVVERAGDDVFDHTTDELMMATPCHPPFSEHL